MQAIKQYSMLVFSNPIDGLTEEYLDWYAGQHIHDLLRIPGYIGCRFFKLSNIQFSDNEQRYQFMIIWDFETDDLARVITEIKARMHDGRTVFIPAFDTQYLTTTFEPITKYITSKEILGCSVDEVLKISELKKINS